MILDFNPSTKAFILRVPRAERDPNAIMREHGLDFSSTASTPREAVLFTQEPYAAASFHEFATPRAQAQLEAIMSEVRASWSPSSARHIDVPPDQELWDFQRASVDYALRRPHTLIADEPGLGKTPIAIAIANEMRAKRVLVVCPASLRLQWERRILQWSTMRGIDRRQAGYTVPCPLVYSILSSGLGVHERAAWTVISWDLVWRGGLWRALAKGKYDLLVLDEAHMAKEITTRRARAIFGGGKDPIAAPIMECAERVVALTGTPLPNRPREAYVLARNLCWESIDWLSEEGFQYRFNPMTKGRGRNNKVWVDERVGRTGELQNRLRGNFMVRHLKREVMPQLQLPVYDLIQVEESKAVKQALEAEALLDIDPDTLEGTDDVLGQIATARRLMGAAIAPQAASYIKMLLDGGETKLVVFAWHIEVLDLLASYLAGVGVIRVDGTDGPRAKDHKVQTFINDPRLQVILGNTLSLGTGTDGLQTVANHALIVEPDWVHANNVQCFDRLDRGGQVRKVQGDIFVAPGSIAERVLAAALRKGRVTFAALDKKICA